MAVKILKDARIAAYRFLGFQLVLTSIMIVICGIFIDKYAAYSVFWGGVVCCAANAVFIKRYFVTTDAQQAQAIVKQFYRAEISKLFISVALFVLVIKFAQVSVLVFFLSYILLQFSFWLTPWFFKLK